jgi:hypothetical protein
MITKQYVDALVRSAALLPVVALGCSSSGNPAPAGPPTTVGPAMPAPTGAAGGAAPSTMMPPPSTMTPPTNPPQGGAPAQDPPDDMMTPPTVTPPDDMPADAYPDLRGMCTISSGFPNDDACITAPPAGEGFQVHVGPDDYTNMTEVNKFVLPAGMELTECYTVALPNTEDVFYQTTLVSGRSGTHHVIANYAAAGTPTGEFTLGCPGGALGTLPGAPTAYVPRARVAPEYADVGRRIPANSVGMFDMHYFNFTQEPLLREFWLNIYTMDEESVKREALQMRGYGGVTWSFSPIQPGTDMVYKYSHPITGNGFIMALLGHYHAHGVRFTMSITRSGMTTKVYETFDYNDPIIFNYNSITQNPPFADGQAGATSGILEVMNGDVLNWECHVINDGTVPLRYTNQVNTGEMCNAWGHSVGITKWDVNM